VWVSKDARAAWEPRIRAVSVAWNKLERLAVVEGIKPATLQTCAPDKLTEVSEWALEKNLVCIPLGMQGASDSYSSAASPVVAGKPFEYRTLITNPHLATIFIEAWKEKDDERIGAALGYPQCCRDFFDWAWVEQNWTDTTLPMSLDHALELKERASLARNLSSIDSIIHHAGPIECNILLRWLGVRLVSHLPCSFYCEKSRKIGESMVILGMQRGYIQEMGWLREMLSWPMRWSSLHGVGSVTTPVFRLVFDSTPLRSLVVVDKDGPAYPEEAARGTEFPFKVTNKVTLRFNSDYKDNGFTSMENMDAAHSVIVEAVSAALEDTPKTLGRKVLDLGCGNGALLERIVEKSSWLIPCGVDQNSSKIQRASRRLAPYDPELVAGDLHDDCNWRPPYSIGIVSVSRLLEVGPEGGRYLLNRLQEGCERVILYSYEHPEWPGYESTSDYFDLLSHHQGGMTCAVVCKPKVHATT